MNIFLARRNKSSLYGVKRLLDALVCVIDYAPTAFLPSNVQMLSSQSI